MHAHESNILTLRLVLLGFLTAAAANAGAQTTMTTDASVRISQTTEMTRAAREAGAPGSSAEHEYPALERDGSGDKITRSAVSSKIGSGAVGASPNTNFWFYTADVVLFNDHDQDGHFHRAHRPAGDL